VTIPTVIGAVALSCLSGFALAIYRFRMNLLIFFLFVAGNFVPFQILMVPVRDLTVSTGLYNTITGLVLFHIAFQTGFCTLFMRNFIKALPFELIESARVEGVSEFRIFWYIVLPLMRPAIAALSVLVFTFIWNDYFWATVLTTSADDTAGHRRALFAERTMDRPVATGLGRVHHRGDAAGADVLPDAEALHCRPDARRDKGIR
jgi:multiple sugar transport system permease protein